MPASVTYLPSSLLLDSTLSPFPGSTPYPPAKQWKKNSFVQQTAHSPLPRLQHPQRALRPDGVHWNGCNGCSVYTTKPPGFLLGRRVNSLDTPLSPFFSISRMGTRGECRDYEPETDWGACAVPWETRFARVSFWGFLARRRCRQGSARSGIAGSAGRVLLGGGRRTYKSRLRCGKSLCAGSELPLSLEAEAVPRRVGERRTDDVVLAGGRVTVMARCGEGESGASRTWSMIAAWRPLLASGGARAYEGGSVAQRWRTGGRGMTMGMEYGARKWVVVGRFLSLGQEGEGVDRPARALVAFGPLVAEEETLCWDDDVDEMINAHRRPLLHQRRRRVPLGTRKEQVGVCVPGDAGAGAGWVRGERERSREGGVCGEVAECVGLGGEAEDGVLPV
ncbi:hypothetical protein B0H14DRAFT_2617627 [Mycena olivaceomarginata]|nr:hypothetical protein B0H14DRAFT_2617627 [Mycena olivaceomarginata]